MSLYPAIRSISGQLSDQAEWQLRDC